MADREAPHAAPAPRRRFGQHFLSDPRLLSRIVDALAPEPSSTVVEIGPGRGALTDRLAERAGRVIAIEIDHDLAALLRRRYAGRPAVQIVDADALAVDWSALAGGAYLLAGNLPYYITSPLLFKALAAPRPRRAVLLVQREVGERLLAPPGTREYGALTVNVGFVARVESIARVPAGAFHPRPSVDSLIIRLTPLDTPLLAAGEEVEARRLVRAAFGMRRKQMKRVVREHFRLTADQADALLRRAAIAPAVRPETLAPADFVRLLRARSP